MKKSILAALVALTAFASPASAQTKYFIRAKVSPAAATASTGAPATARCQMGFVTGVSLGTGQYSSVLGSVPNDGVDRLSQIQALCDKAPSGTTACIAFPASNGMPIDVFGYTQPTSGGGTASGDYRRAYGACTG